MPKTYNTDDLTKGVNLIKEGMTWRAVEQEVRIPKSVLRRFYMGKQLGVGRKTVLDAGEEKELELCLLARARMGYPVDKKELLNLVKEFIDIKGINTPFKENKPGQKWYQGFMRRHSTISLKRPEVIQNIRIKSRDPFVVFEFFNLVRELYGDCLVDDNFRIHIQRR